MNKSKNISFMKGVLTPEERNKIIVQFNFPAPPITEEEMKKVLTGSLEDHERHWVTWLEMFLGLPQKSFTQEVLERFREINTSDTFMSVAPSIQKLLKPLKDSCKAYSLGLYSASVALSAVAAESLQILIWEMHGMSINGALMTSDQEKVILGKKFERIYQERRIEMLYTCSWITLDQKNLFHIIRNVRNRYLHSWSEDFSSEKEDALQCYRYAFKIFREITGVALSGASSIAAKPLLVKWMGQHAL